MKISIDLGSPNFPEHKEGEQLTSYSMTILNSLLTDSINKTLGMDFSVENQQKIAEEIGYRRALLEFQSYFSSQENT